MKVKNQPHNLRSTPGILTPSLPQAQMPEPHVYEQEYVYWPWGKLLEVAADWVAEHAPRSAVVVDYMCGTGFLLNEIVKRRPDITAFGCDINPEYIGYGERKYSGVHFIVGDALDYEPPRRPELVICTAGVHHLTRKAQPWFMKKVSGELAGGGHLLLGEELIRPYGTEAQRRKAVWEMFAALMSFILEQQAPEDVIQAAADMMVNDFCERGEYKTSRPGLAALVEPYFEIVSKRLIWPAEDADFGDWLLVCRKHLETSKKSGCSGGS